MLERFKSLEDIIEINLDELSTDASLVDELLSDDFLVALGYDKRKNKGVRKLNTVGENHWRISFNGTEAFILKFISLNNSCELIENEQSKGLLDSVKGYKYYIVTNIKSAIVYDLESVIGGDIRKVLTIEEDSELWEFLDKEKFSIDSIEEYYNAHLLTAEKVGKYIEENENILIEEILTKMGFEATENNIGITRDYFKSTHIDPEAQAEASINIEELEALRKKVAELEDNNFEVELSEKNTKIIKLEETVSNLKAKLDSLEGKEASDENTNSAAKEALELKYNAVLNDLNIQKDLNDSLKKSLDEAKIQLKNVIESKNSSTDYDMDADKFKGIEADYRKQIADLVLEKETLIDNMKKIEKELYDIKSSQLSEKEVKKNLARSLIDAIEDDPESERIYVGAINSKLFQNKDICKFIGNCIVELYDIVKYKLMTQLYDGDLFKFIHPATRVDFTINNKNYQISLDNETEESLFFKLEKLFNKFEEENIAFEYKFVGKEAEKLDTESESDSDLNLDSEFGETSESEDTDEAEDSEEEAEDSEESLFDDDSIGDSNEAELTSLGKTADAESSEFSSIEEQEYYTEDDEEQESEWQGSKLLRVPLSELSSLAWSDGTVLTNIKYVGDSLNTYKVSADMENELDLQKEISKSIDSILAIVPNFDEAIRLLREQDLSETSAFISKIDSENRRYPKVSFTKYVITPIDSVAKCLPILMGVCECINQNTDDVYMYVEATYTSDMSHYEINESEIDLRISPDFMASNEESSLQCLILGNIPDYVVLTKNSLKMQSEMFRNCLAVKTNYCTLDISTPEKKTRAIQAVITQSKTAIDTNIIGNVLNTNYKIISEYEGEVSEDRYEIETETGKYYISNMEEWQFIYALIKMHTIICKNKQIAIKCDLSKEAFEYYDSIFTTFEPSLKLSVRSLIEYINDRMRNS